MIFGACRAFSLSVAVCSFTVSSARSRACFVTARDGEVSVVAAVPAFPSQELRKFVTVMAFALFNRSISAVNKTSLGQVFSTVRLSPPAKAILVSTSLDHVAQRSCEGPLRDQSTFFFNI
jgi:hypothetical protein